ncbi:MULTISPECIES: glycosyltransferase family 4 protein [Calditerrivibrio]|uniref:glycosyltransferase family 4 protein n=1 Tax=Calditerrivibrio TaxID=545865 RepID=UPI003C775DEC
MKILHIEAGRNLYGGAKQVLYLLEGLQKEGFENILITPTGSAISKYATIYSKVYEIGFLGDMDITFPFRLNKIIKREQPDLVHVHSRKGVDFWGGMVARLNGLPSICTRRVDNLEIKFLAKFKYYFYDYIVAISDGIKKVLSNVITDESKLKTIRSVIDPSPFRDTESKEKFLAEFGLTNSDIVIGVIAQLIERKGHRYLINIMPEIIKEFPNVKVIFFGKGAIENKLKKMIKDLGLTVYFIFAGFREDIEKWIGLLDIVVHPADMEGLGISLIQASAAGVPIIASNVGGIPEIVKDGINGFLIEKGDEKGLYSRLLTLLNNKSLREDFGKNGMKIVDSEFSVDSMVREYIHLYNNLKKEPI